MTRVRDSGMTDEATWEGFFDAPRIVEALGVGDGGADVVEFGCGYGTFTIPAARRARGTVRAFDIDPLMVARTAERAAAEGLANVRAACRDFVDGGTGLPDSCASGAMLFNLLHHDRPDELMAEARRVLAPGGRLAVIHWIHDPTTPRGPGLSIRPRPAQCLAWAHAAGFEHDGTVHDLPPYHWGIVVRRPGA